jgi:hypothetical protein
VAAFVLLEMPNTTGSPLFELAFVLVRFDRVASTIVNADHGITAMQRLV